jgi:hypothetical protein
MPHQSADICPADQLMYGIPTGLPAGAHAEVLPVLYTHKHPGPYILIYHKPCTRIRGFLLERKLKFFLTCIRINTMNPIYVYIINPMYIYTINPVYV